MNKMTKNIKNVFIITIILLLSSTNFSFGQSIDIIYSFTNTSPEHPELASEFVYHLISDNTVSIYSQTEEKLLQDYGYTTTTDNNDGFQTQKVFEGYYRILMDREITYKDYNKGNIEFNTSIFKKEFFVKEKLGDMEWNMTDIDTTFLDFSCKVATTNYKGKMWTVFFTDQLNFNVAPWKFNGLPGTVLYAISDDNIYSFNAISVKTHTETLKIENPFSEKEQKKMISWNEYKKIYKKTLEKFVGKLKTDDQDGNENSEAKILITSMEDLGFAEVK